MFAVKAVSAEDAQKAGQFDVLLPVDNGFLAGGVEEVLYFFGKTLLFGEQALFLFSW